MATATYTKLKDGSWGLRITGAVNAGATIAVQKKDGTTKKEVIAKVLWAGEGVSLCAITRGSDSQGLSIRSGASYRAGVTAPGRRACPECGSRECAKAWDRRSLCDED